MHHPRASDLQLDPDAGNSRRVAISKAKVSSLPNATSSKEHADGCVSLTEYSDSVVYVKPLSSQQTKQSLRTT